MKEAASMAIQLSIIVEGDGLSSDRVSSNNHELFKDILEECQQNLEKGHCSGFYGSKLGQTSKNNSKSMLWHLLIICWCLSI